MGFVYMEQGSIENRKQYEGDEGTYGQSSHNRDGHGTIHRVVYKRNHTHNGGQEAISTGRTRETVASTTA